jgi:hypothetical protein
VALDPKETHPLTGREVEPVSPEEAMIALLVALIIKLLNED